MNIVNMEDIESFAVSDMLTILENESWLLLDVRHNFERSSGFLPGLHIPLEDLQSRHHEISDDKNILVYCRCGNRSVTAIHQLNTLGFKNRLVNLDGGIIAVRKAESKGTIKMIEY